MRSRQFLFRALVLAGVAAALLWPAFWNRGPFFFPDTRTYMRGADSALTKLTHRPTAWTSTESSAAASNTSANLALHNVGEARTRSLEEIGRKGILLGRSPYYGLLLYAGSVTGGFWLTIFMQACALLLAAWLTLRALEAPVWPSLPWLGLGLCLVPAAPFFLSYLMPDLFAGIAILACGVLIATHHRPARKDLLLWYLLLSAAMLFHDSCILIAVSLFGLALLANLMRRSRLRVEGWPNWRGLTVILLAIVTCWAGQSVVAYGAKKATGKPPLRLPFLSARLIADGPGTDYLRATCPQSHFALCGYAGEFPLLDAEFLFGTQPGRSVFETAPYEQRSALAAEQFRFFLAVLRYDPIGVLRTSARDAGEQLIDFRLSTFDYDPSMKDAMDRTFPLSVLATVRRSPAYLGTMPVAALSAVLYAAVAGSLIYLLLVLFRGGRNRSMSSGLKRLFAWISIGIAVNAGVCGALSAVDPRYEARVIWLIPMVALLAESRRWNGAKRSA